MPAALELLPDEILQLIVARLSTPHLKSVAVTCRTLHRHATDLLWRHVCLMDQWQLHLNEQTQHLWGDRGHGECDEHDDSRIIQKLYVLASNPELAAKVQVLTHRCHLPTPNIFTDLPRMHFHGPTLSQDERLQSLLRLAIRNMVKLHTLRIIYGHMHLSSALVAGFLDSTRPRHGPLRKLWLESCCLAEDTLSVLLPSKTTNLESIRMRRLEFAPLTALRTRHMGRFEFCLARGSQYYQLLNGAGGWVGTTVHWSEQGLPERWPRPSSTELRHKAEMFDAAIWQKFPAIRDYIEHQRPLTPASPLLPTNRNPFSALLEFSAPTLTSLNLDWLLWRRTDSDSYDESKSVLALLANMRYPHLRAFQVRNAILPLTKLPDNVFLLQGDLLDFMEAHPKIQCLGWPIDRFYSHHRSSIHNQNRVRKLIAHLSDMITDLRIDTQFTGHGEPLTDASQTLQETQERVRRRQFIAEFVPHMKKIQQVKLEGGLPRDEKREILRGLHHCNLKKIVMIGTSFPPGNTWGAQGVQLKALDPGLGSDTVYNLEDEDLPGILESYRRGFPVLTNFQFEPEYGWSNQAPLLQVIALHHARTVEELKICGYNGCPVLSCQTAITDPLLNGIRHFHSLKQLVISFWLLTWYEDSYRDTEIIQSWIDRRSSCSTALITVTPPQSAGQELPVDPGHFPNFSATRPPPRHDFNRWAVTLKTRFSPSALAYRLAQDIGPYLSPEAKNQPGGVRVRGSFCLGAREERRAANDIFDMDIRIGRNDQVLEFMGPREEAESSRWWQKLENRQWF